MVLVCAFLRLIHVEVASLFCLLIRAATKRLISFWFKSGCSFTTRTDSDSRVQEVGMESSGVLVRSRVASDSSLDGPWVNPSFVDSMADMGLFLLRFGMNSMDNNRLALSGMGQLGFIAISFTIVKFQQSEEIPVIFYFYFKI